MSGAYYLALGGMRARLGALDRLASDIANVSTAGYKAERATTAQSDRPDFGATLTAAIDVSEGATRIDFRAGAIAPTGRDLDAAIDGPGFSSRWTRPPASVSRGTADSSGATTACSRPCRGIPSWARAVQ